MAQNTGNVKINTLEEYYVNGPNAGQRTGNEKANTEADAGNDYIAPFPADQVNYISCSTAPDLETVTLSANASGDGASISGEKSDGTTINDQVIDFGEVSYCMKAGGYSTDTFGTTGSVSVSQGCA